MYFLVCRSWSSHSDCSLQSCRTDGHDRWFK